MAGITLPGFCIKSEAGNLAEICRLCLVLDAVAAVLDAGAAVLGLFYFIVLLAGGKRISDNFKS